MLYRRLAANIFLRDVLRQVVRLLLILAGAVLALEVMDASALVGAVLGATGLAGFAVAFAFRDTFENYIASILLSIRQPFEPNDHVLIEGHEGRVIRLTPRATVLLTLDGNHVRIPNALVFKGIITNYTHNPNRRFEFDLGVGTEEDLVDVQDRILETMGTIKGVLSEPPPQCWVIGLGDSSVQLTVSGWVDQRHTDFGKARSEAVRLVKQSLDEAGVAMPEPIYNLRLEGAGESIPETSPRPRTGVPVLTRDAIDTSRDTHLDQQVASDRAQGDDLLSPAAPKE
jgi:small-conductance mechanosensitive channel